MRNTRVGAIATVPLLSIASFLATPEATPATFGGAGVNGSGESGSGAAMPSQISADSVAIATVRKLIDDAHHPLLRWRSFPDLRDDLERFYGARGYEPVWIGDSAVSPERAAEALDFLRAADARGLRVEDYDAAALSAMWGRRGSLDGYEIALFDVGLTVALFRHLSALHVGRVDPRNLNIGFNIEPRREDLVAKVGEALARGRLEEVFREAEPDFLQYEFLIEALARYRTLAARAAAPLPETGVVREGDAYAGLSDLTELLTALGDLEDAGAPGGADPGRAGAPTGGAPGSAPRYEGELVDAVKRFQERHGLDPDGILGPLTFAALNVPLTDRVRQIELALERLRWLPPLDDGPFIVVNIPAFELWAYDAPGVEKFLEEGPSERMRVVVGRALNTQTPVFMEDMRWFEFRPYWNVPYGITVREILPLARRDPEYLKANDYEIVPAFGNEVQPLPVTPENLERLGSGQLHLRQRPGPHNALGLVKFIFPNNANVYLHSTPAQELFSRTRRDFSHGCVRVEDPVALSKFVLRNDGREWSRAEIQAAMNGERPTRVNLSRPIPVIIFYTTALVEPDGTVRFYDDIYRHDAILGGALAAGYPYPR